MKKEPFLTNFPRTIFASQTRKVQASFRALRQHLSIEASSGYSVLFREVIPSSYLLECDPTKRNRHFGCVPIFWGWVSQILDENASCSKAVSLMQTWCQQEGLPVPSSDTSSYCKGRMRLPESFIEKISEQVQSNLNREISGSDQWHGMVLKAIDGSSVKLEDTAANQKAFPQPCGQKAGCGFPVMGITGLLNLSHGGWEDFTTATLNTQDATMAWDLMDSIHSGDLILADRAYNSFAYIAKLLEKGAHSLIRLHQKREATLDWRKGKKISSFERIVHWKRPAFNPRTGMSKEEWKTLPEEMPIRLIRLACKDRSGKQKMMTLMAKNSMHCMLVVGKLN